MIVRLRPAREGLRLRGPDGVLLPPDGRDVEWGSFWARRLRDGDVVLVAEQVAERPAARKSEVTHAG